MAEILTKLDTILPETNGLHVLCCGEDPYIFVDEFNSDEEIDYIKVYKRTGTSFSFVDSIVANDNGVNGETVLSIHFDGTYLFALISGDIGIKAYSFIGETLSYITIKSNPGFGNAKLMSIDKNLGYIFFTETYDTYMLSFNGASFTVLDSEEYCYPYTIFAEVNEKILYVSSMSTETVWVYDYSGGELIYISQLDIMCQCDGLHVTADRKLIACGVNYVNDPDIVMMYDISAGGAFVSNPLGERRLAYALVDTDSSTPVNSNSIRIGCPTWSSTNFAFPIAPRIVKTNCFGVDPSCLSTTSIVADVRS